MRSICPHKWSLAIRVHQYHLQQTIKMSLTTQLIPDLIDLILEYAQDNCLRLPQSSSTMIANNEEKKMIFDKEWSFYSRDPIEIITSTLFWKPQWILGIYFDYQRNSLKTSVLQKLWQNGLN